MGGPVCVRDEAEKLTLVSTANVDTKQRSCRWRKAGGQEGFAGRELDGGGWRADGGPWLGPSFVSTSEPTSAHSHQGHLRSHKSSILGAGEHCHGPFLSASSTKGFGRFKIQHMGVY